MGHISLWWELGAAFGMLVVETIAKIRRAYFHQKKPIKAICRELKISRKAVRKAIRSEATEFRYERSVQPMPKLGAWREQLDGLLASNGGKPSRERLTLMRIFVPIDVEDEDQVFRFQIAAKRRMMAYTGAENHSPAEIDDVAPPGSLGGADARGTPRGSGCATRSRIGWVALARALLRGQARACRGACGSPFPSGMTSLMSVGQVMSAIHLAGTITWASRYCEGRLPKGA